jgi:hypothetical protein
MDMVHFAQFSTPNHVENIGGEGLSFSWMAFGAGIHLTQYCSFSSQTLTWNLPVLLAVWPSTVPGLGASWGHRDVPRGHSPEGWGWEHQRKLPGP